MIIDNIIQIFLLCISFSYFIPFIIIYNNYKFIKYNNYFINSEDKINNIIGYTYYSIEYVFILCCSYLFKIGIIKELYIKTNNLYIIYDNKLYENSIFLIKKVLNLAINHTLKKYNLFKIMNLCFINNNSDKNSDNILDNILDNKLDNKLDNPLENKLDNKVNNLLVSMINNNNNNNNISNLLDNIKNNMDMSDSSEIDSESSNEEYTDNIKKKN